MRFFFETSNLSKIGFLFLLFICVCLLMVCFNKKNSFLNNDKFTAIYWGAFDPPTNAHKAIIDAVLAHKSMNDLIIVINNHNYKKYTFSLENRKKFIEATISSISTKKQIKILSQDDNHPLDYGALEKTASYPLCAIAGYDAYSRWMAYSSPNARSQYKAIAVIPRGGLPPDLFDPHAFLLNIDSIYKDVSSTQLKALSSSDKISNNVFIPSSDCKASAK